MEQNSDTGAWVVVTSGVAKYIGKVTLDAAGTAKERSAAVREDAQATGFLTLQPAYEYYAQLGRTAEGNIKREAVVTHPDFVLENKQLPLLLRVDHVYCFDDMAADDRKLYDDFVKKADEHIAAAMEQSRGRKTPSRLVIVPPGGLPR